MSGQRGGDTVAFLDVAAYFSEEEWKLLHEWQKDLYRNVMKEIHQALVSLGPLIATTVCSLRAKEKEESGPVAFPGSERRHGIHHSPSDAITNPDVFFEINGEDTLHLKNPQDTEERLARDCFSTGFPCLNRGVYSRNEEEPVSIFIDRLGAQVQEISTDSTSVVSLCIKEEEEETYCIEPPDGKRSKSTRSPTGERTMNRKCKGGEPVKPAEQSTSHNALPGDARVGGLHGIPYSGRLWSDIIQELEEETAIQNSFSNSAHFILSQRIPKVELTETFHNPDTDLDLANLLACQENMEHGWMLYSCSDCEKHFSKKEYLIRHKRTHMGEKPYQCAECEKTFRKKEYLVVHKRTHTGEKPYHCTKCEKSFSQKGVLNRHQRTHVTKHVDDYPRIP